jgi:hypothetical protein
MGSGVVSTTVEPHKMYSEMTELEARLGQRNSWPRTRNLSMVQPCWSCRSGDGSLGELLAEERIQRVSVLVMEVTKFSWRWLMA